MKTLIRKDGKVCIVPCWERLVADGVDHGIKNWMSFEWSEFCRLVGDNPEDFIEVPEGMDVTYSAERGVFEGVTRVNKTNI